VTKKILSTKELICILATLLIVTGIHVLAGLCAAAQPTTIKGLVVGVSDGDTIKILTPAKEELRIRLYGIDCPEKRQAFGQAAKKFTSDQVYKKNVSVTVLDTDRYGRKVGLVYYGQECVNAKILKAGLAWVYDKYCKAAVCRDFDYYEQEARKSRLGLWSYENPIPPWEFRKKR